MLASRRRPAAGTNCTPSWACRWTSHSSEQPMLSAAALVATAGVARAAKTVGSLAAEAEEAEVVVRVMGATAEAERLAVETVTVATEEVDREEAGEEARARVLVVGNKAERQ